ncbi:hypothetical protein XENOCAPTIV_002760, partial [Xenoophorus captivus]
LGTTASSCWPFSVSSPKPKKPTKNGLFTTEKPMFDTSHVFIPPVAFLFNWIGFCLSFCLTNTIAGRYGAICGFGLSLIKWILIVRRTLLGQKTNYNVDFSVLLFYPRFSRRQEKVLPV